MKLLNVYRKFVWYDIWIGAYWNRDAHCLYVCPLPMLVIIFEFDYPDHVNHWIRCCECGISKPPSEIIEEFGAICEDCTA